MSDWAPRRLREAELQKAEARLAAAPDDVEARFYRCGLLAELGRAEDAKAAYLELLARAPNHFGALNNFGNLVYAMGFKKAARTLYSRAVELHPDKPMGHVNLANLLAEKNEVEAAMRHYHAALSLDPEHVEANRGAAYLWTRLRDEPKADFHRRKAFAHRRVIEFPYTGAAPPIRLLLLVSASGGTIPMRHHMDESIFLASALFVEFYEPGMALPPHDLMVNTIGDADLCRAALEAAAGVAAKTSAPLINHPAKVLRTGRLENSRRLAEIDDVLAPRIKLAPREFFNRADAAAVLKAEGFTFPLLLRSPGFHTGQYFERVDDESTLAPATASVLGDELMAIQFIDGRAADGKIRKYRVMMIGGELYPLHAAISHDWKIHYFTAEMADNADHRAEDARFLDDMPAVLGPRAMKALRRIRETLGLEYAGIDFGLSPDGKIVLYEANATMVVNPPEKDARWDYRRPAVQRVLDAIRELLMRRPK